MTIDSMREVVSTCERIGGWISGPPGGTSLWRIENSERVDNGDGPCEKVEPRYRPLGVGVGWVTSFPTEEPGVLHPYVVAGTPTLGGQEGTGHVLSRKIGGPLRQERDGREHRGERSEEYPKDLTGGCGQEGPCRRPSVRLAGKTKFGKVPRDNGNPIFRVTGAPEPADLGRRRRTGKTPGRKVKSVRPETSRASRTSK